MEKPWSSATKQTEEILKLYRDLKINSKSKELTWKEKNYSPQTKEGEEHIFYEIGSDRYFFVENKETNCLIVLEQNYNPKFNLILKSNSSDNYQVKDVNLNSRDFWGSIL